MSKRVFQLAREYWTNRTISFNGFRRTYRVECCPKIISPIKLDTKSNCHIIETISRDINTKERTTTAAQRTTTAYSTTAESFTTTKPLLEVKTTLPNVSVRKDQVCE